MTHVTLKDKNKIRKDIINKLKNQKEEDRERKSGVILEKLFTDPGFQCSHTILFYASFAGEVDTFDMMKRAQKQGKRIALPAISLPQKTMIPCFVNNLDEELEKGPYGIRQPRTSRARALTVDEIDLSIVPGVAFDKQNHRLGRGAGYYDRFLSSFPPGKLAIGLAYDFQIVDSLPVEEHDISVTRVISN